MSKDKRKKIERIAYWRKIQKSMRDARLKREKRRIASMTEMVRTDGQVTT